MKKSHLLLLSIFLIIFAFAFMAQAEMIEKTSWLSPAPGIAARGIAVGRFDEATQKLYAATSDDGLGVNDVRINYNPGGPLVLTTPARIRATAVYNIPTGGIAGQVDAALYLTGGTGLIEITEPATLPDGGIVQEKIVRATADSRNITIATSSRDILPAGSYWTTFEFRIPGFAGTISRHLRADSVSGAQLVSLRLETISSGGGSAKSSSGGTPSINRSLPSAKPLPR